MTVTRTPDDTTIFTPYIKDALLNLNANFIPVTLQHEPRSTLFSQLFIQMRCSSGEGQSRNNPVPLRAFPPRRIVPPPQRLSLLPARFFPLRRGIPAEPDLFHFCLKWEIPNALKYKS